MRTNIKIGVKIQIPSSKKWSFIESFPCISPSLALPTVSSHTGNDSARSSARRWVTSFRLSRVFELGRPWVNFIHVSGERMVIPRQLELYFPGRGQGKRNVRAVWGTRGTYFFPLFTPCRVGFVISRANTDERAGTAWVTLRYTKIVFRAMPRPDFQCSPPPPPRPPPHPHPFSPLVSVLPVPRAARNVPRWRKVGSERAQITSDDELSRLSNNRAFSRTAVINGVKLWVTLGAAD